MMGREGYDKRVYLCGFGEGKHLMKEGVHCEYREGRKVRGSVGYLSINRHLGI